MITSPVADLLIRIKNAYRANRKVVTTPQSKFNTAITEMLKKHGFINDFEVKDGQLEIKLAYDRSAPKLTGLRLISTPGRRIYENALHLPWGQNSRSLIIVSTSKGLMSQREAVKAHLGGEIIAEIY
ncbi:30S ribosomal protein S8 [Patescibacteria group bacterium]|nr:30S ribosomal protein S8 [Patescibacteria group bacterium]